MRRKKRNPGPLLLVVLGAGGLAAVGAVGFALFGKKKTLTTTTGQEFTPTTEDLQLGGFKTAEGILGGDCIFAKQGAAGFSVPGVPAGESTPLKVISSGGASARSVFAESIDPRVPPGTQTTVPVGAISGAGDCAVGFA